MSPKKIAELLGYQWTPTYERLEDGSWRLTVHPLNDFELFGKKTELEATWREALESHLVGYLAVGKAVPLPGGSVTVIDSDRSTRGVTDAMTVRFDKDMQFA